MNVVNQPENTTKTDVRDAAVQIGGEDKGLLIKELFHVEQVKKEKSKSQLIKEGLEIELRKELPECGDDRIMLHAYGTLAIICSMLTSSAKEEREFAKKKIRKYVQLGKGE